MNTQISTKLTALAVAVMMNSLLIGGVAYVFSCASPRVDRNLARARGGACTGVGQDRHLFAHAYPGFHPVAGRA